MGSLDSALDWGSSASWQRALELPISRCRQQPPLGNKVGTAKCCPLWHKRATS